LDKSSKFYKQKEKYAEKMALEMQRTGSNTKNIHLMEERGMTIPQTDIDEELYGAVLREVPKQMELPTLNSLDKEQSHSTTSLTEPKKGNSEEPTISTFPKDDRFLQFRKFSIQSPSNSAVVFI
jgi:PAB1-binding protein PBP1